MRGQILGGDNILTLTATFSRVMCVSTGDGVSSHQLFSSLPWSSDVAEVAGVVVIVILNDVDPLEGDVAHIMVDIVALIKDYVNIDIVRGIITFLKSVGRNLVTQNEHSWLILTLLPIVKRMLLQLLLVLPLWYFHRLSMIGCVNSSSLRIIIQQLMHPLQAWMPILPLHPNLDIRFRSSILHGMYQE